MPRPLWLLAGSLAAALFCHCSDDTTAPPGGDRGGAEAGFADGQPPSGDGPRLDLGPREARPPGEFGAGGCDQLGNHLQLADPINQFQIDATEVTPESGAKGLIGFSGISSDGYRFWFGRLGDPDAAAFTDATIYHATQAPYHLLLQRWPEGSGASCAASSQCQTYYGLNGQFQFFTVKAPAQGKFNISSITTQKDCWVEQPSGPPVVSGCPLLGLVYGCFKVD